jgi:hypothetical protein
LISEDHLRLSLLRYFAADLTADERTLFEERLLTDQDFSDAVAVHEQDLIDAYALGSLTAEEARSIQTWIEASPRRMQRVSMARAFLIRRPQKIRRKQYVTIMLAAAACILAAVGITLSLTSKSMRQNSKSVSSGTIAAVQSSMPDTSPGNAAKPEVILLVAERIRGQQQSTTHQLHRGVPVQLQIILAGETERSGYLLRLHSLGEDKHVLPEYKDLNAESVGGQLYIKVDFLPGSLPPGTYRAFVSKGGDTLVSDFAVRW